MVVGRNHGVPVVYECRREYRKTRPFNYVLWSGGRFIGQLFGDGPCSKELSRSWRDPTRRVEHVVARGDWACDNKYPSKGIERVLKQEFGDAKLSDTLSNILVTSYEMKGHKPYSCNATKAGDDRATETIFYGT